MSRTRTSPLEGLFGQSNVPEIMTGLVMTGRDGTGSGSVTCGETKNEDDRYGRSVVTTSACFQAELAVVTGKKFLAEKGPVC